MKTYGSRPLSAGVLLTFGYSGLLPKEHGGRYEGFEERLKAAQDAGMSEGDAAMVAWINPSDDLVDDKDYPPLYGCEFGASLGSKHR